MRIPDGDLAPARRRRRRGGFGRRRASPLRRALPLVLAAALVGGAGAWGYAQLRGDDAPVEPVGVAQTACATPSATPAAAALPAPSAVRLRLLNGTPRDGLGKAVGDALTGRGFVVTDTGNADRPLAGPSRVYHGPGAGPAAQAVAVHVIGAELVPVPSAPRGAVDLVLGTSFTRVRTDAEVREFTARVLRRATPTPSAAACA